MEMEAMDAMAAMVHPGLPQTWGLAVLLFVVCASAWALAVPGARAAPTGHFSLSAVPGVGHVMRYFIARPWMLFLFRLIFVAIFLLIIAAGLYGTPIPERNAATVLTWNIWWSGLVLSIFFLGSAWCGVCPWNSIANWLVNRRLWRRADVSSSLGLTLPKWLRNVWPALLMFIGLTWLELGVGVTVDPFVTAILALAMVVMATVSLAVFQRNAFCHHFCPVGRTVGFYSQLAPVELRPVDPDICARCTTLECYAGSQTVDPCPTHLVMGRLTQNTYCTSCGNCTRSCPDANVAWRLRSPAAEAMQDARPHWDEAWFMLVLLGLTGFHGLTMLPSWEDGIIGLARVIGDSGRMLVTFSAGLAASLAVPVIFYGVAVWATGKLAGDAGHSFKSLFSRFAFVALPLAFAYHLVHNLGHLAREGAGLGAVLANPLGVGTLPLGAEERQLRMMDMLISQDALFAFQALLMAFGFLIAVGVIQRRCRGLAKLEPGRAPLLKLPLLLFAAFFTGFHLWLLMQPMVMRL